MTQNPISALNETQSDRLLPVIDDYDSSFVPNITNLSSFEMAAQPQHTILDPRNCVRMSPEEMFQHRQMYETVSYLFPQSQDVTNQFLLNLSFERVALQELITGLMAGYRFKNDEEF